VTETELQSAVIECAQLLGWRVAHFRPALTAKGWRTPVSGDGKGFPDLVLVKGDVLFVELKSDSGKQSPEQHEWARAIVKASGEFHLWRPRDWISGAVEAVLR
jgi:hypothetical protein